MSILITVLFQIVPECCSHPLYCTPTKSAYFSPTYLRLAQTRTQILNQSRQENTICKWNSIVTAVRFHFLECLTLPGSDTALIICRVIIYMYYSRVYLSIKRMSLAYGNNLPAALTTWPQRVSTPVRVEWQDGHLHMYIKRLPVLQIMINPDKNCFVMHIVFYHRSSVQCCVIV